MTPEVGCIVANRFELVRELGRGSMGTVWLANHLALSVPCAVKFMTGEATRDPNYAARFELEAKAIARLSSPNIVRVIDYDTDEGVPFIAMECLQGEDLGARLRRVGKLDAESTYRIISQVAHGLAKAHAAGIVHRDLKPDNIFLAKEDDDVEVAKIVDFGIAKLTGFAASDGLSSSTQAGSLIGTPAYMSPEQARGVSDLDHRSDLWSLAVIAFECVTGRLPFDSTSLGDLFAKILFEPIPVPSDVAPDSAPRTLDRWWTHAASRAVEDRYTSAIELADALGRALGVVKDEVRETLRARSWEGSMVVARPSATPGLPRRRLSKVVVAAIALVIAPIALMVTSGRIDARTARALGASHAALTAAAAPASAVSAAATPSVPAVTVAPPSLPVAPTRIADTHTVAAYRAPSRAQAASVMDAPAMAAGLAASITNGISAASSIKDDSPPALPAPVPAPGVGSHPRPASSPDDSDFGI